MSGKYKNGAPHIYTKENQWCASVHLKSFVLPITPLHLYVDHKIWIGQNQWESRPVRRKLILEGLKRGASKVRINRGPGACPRENFS